MRTSCRASGSPDDRLPQSVGRSAVAPRALAGGAIAVACLLAGCGLIARQVQVAYLAVKAEAKSIEIRIDRSFIERYKNRVTIAATFTVDKAMGSPNPGFIDGDLHLAGRAPEIALPSVAEIANAASYPVAVDIVHRAERTRRPLRITGVWRLWTEHSGGTTAEQGRPLEPADTNNPDHVFEIHPVARIDALWLLDSFRPVEGFKPGDAQRTFGIYEKAACTLRVEPKTVSIVSPPGLYNDVEFVLELADDRPFVVADGRFATASVWDEDGALVVKRVRMVFAKGTPPERAVSLLRHGERLRVWGIPRIDLAEVSRRVTGSTANPALLTGNLPYEIIIVGVYPK